MIKDQGNNVRQIAAEARRVAGEARRLALEIAQRETDQMVSRLGASNVRALPMRRFWRDRRGLAATEFAMILPLMLALLFGTVEITQGIIADTRTTHVAASAQQMTHNRTSTTTAELQGLLGFSALNMGDTPISAATPLTQRLTLSGVDQNGVAHVAWSVSSGAALPALQAGAVDGDVPPSLLGSPQTWVLRADAVYHFGAGLNWFISSAGFDLRETAWGRPPNGCILLSDVQQACEVPNV